MSTKGWFLKCFNQFSKILENLKGWPYVISDLTRKKGSISRGISHFRSECIFQFDEIQEWSFARNTLPSPGLFHSTYRLIGVQKTPTPRDFDSSRLATVSMAIGDSSCYTYRGFETTRTPAGADMCRRILRMLSDFFSGGLKVGFLLGEKCSQNGGTNFGPTKHQRCYIDSYQRCFWKKRKFYSFRFFSPKTNDWLPVKLPREAGFEWHSSIRVKHFPRIFSTCRAKKFGLPRNPPWEPCYMGKSGP